MATDQEVLIQLIKIAEKQRRILNRLAQEVVQDPNIQWLNDAAHTVGTNMSTPRLNVQVSKTAGSQYDNTTIDGGYTVGVGGLPKDNAKRNDFILSLKTMIGLQRPNLVSGLSIVFTD